VHPRLERLSAFGRGRRRPTALQKIADVNSFEIRSFSAVAEGLYVPFSFRRWLRQDEFLSKKSLKYDGNSSKFSSNFLVSSQSKDDCLMYANSGNHTRKVNATTARRKAGFSQIKHQTTSADLRGGRLDSWLI